jgi:hypothetical protein
MIHHRGAENAEAIIEKELIAPITFTGKVLGKRGGIGAIGSVGLFFAMSYTSAPSAPLRLTDE